jgi:hypothetical protein
MTDSEVLDQIAGEFGACPRPEHFTNYTHCCECFEHDAVLLSRDRETLGHADVGSEAWDPICFVVPEGFAYYMPALARLALSPPDETWGWYGGHLVFHLCLDGPRNVRWVHSTPGQRRAVAALLEHMIEARADLVDESYRVDMFFAALEIWSDCGEVERSRAGERLRPR